MGGDMGADTMMPTPAVATDTGGELVVSLDAAGMTPLHRVGVAGLWMTLDAFDHEPSLAKPIHDAGGSWVLGERSATLRWAADSKRVLEALVRASFQVEPTSGLVYFPGLGPPSEHPAHAVLVQDALLGTFLQHGKTRKADAPDKKTGSLTSGDQDGGEVTTLSYRRIGSYAHQAAKLDLAGASTPLAGWNYPGGVVRHTGFTGATALGEPAHRYLALLFAPVAAYYFQLRPRTRKLRPQYCLVLPEVDRLARYAEQRRRFQASGERAYVAAGGAEAALRVLLHLRAEELLARGRFMGCRVMEFGVVAWASQQKTRVGLLDVAPGSAAALGAFRAVEQLLSPRRVTLPNGDSFISAPQTPELVARNVIAGRPWWRGFADFLDDLDRRKAVLSGERKGLAEMVSEQLEPEGSPEVVFVQACHEAWRRRLGKLSERAKRERLDFNALVGREFEQQRIAFARCKNAATLREAITDYWSRGGSLPPLQERWGVILPFLGDNRWQEGRDLALLALASYRGSTRDEQKALDTLGESSEENT